MTIKIEEIKAGDRVTVEGVVIGVKNDVVCFDAGVGGDAARHYAHVSGIVSHTPAPREFTPGDPVTIVGHDTLYEFVSVFNAENGIVARVDNAGAPWVAISLLSALRHADPAPASQEPAKERRKVERWINFYPDGHASTFDTRETADIIAGASRIACLHVVGYEGDGL
jgi:hypothetical protein